jgi:hypothetical protein
MSPFVFFGVASFFIGGLLNEPLCIFQGCHFFNRRSSERAHLHFFVVASIFIESLLNEPHCIFLGCLFFIRGLLNEPLCIFQGCHFSSDVF